MKFCKLLLLLLLFIIIVNGQLFYGGLVLDNKLLTLESSPFYITQDVIIEKTGTLTIEPGVELYFSPRIGIKVFGSLIANGTEDKKIIFTKFNSNKSTYPSINYVQWARIRLVDGDDPSEGRLQIRHNSQWFSVCTNSKNWTTIDINVACQELGFERGKWYQWFPRHNESLHFMYESPRCSGSEKSIINCENWDKAQIGSGICKFHADLGLKCSKTLYPQPKYWSGISFLDADYEEKLLREFSDKVKRKVSYSFLSNLIIHYAGEDEDGNAVPAVSSFGVPPNIEKLEIKWCAYTGLNISLPSDSFTIEDSNFEENRGFGIFVNTSFGNVQIKNVTVKDNGADGIRFVGHQVIRSGYTFCEFTSVGENQVYPVHLTYQQSKDWNSDRSCCQEFKLQNSLVSNVGARLTVHFPYLMSEDTNNEKYRSRNGTIEVWSGYSSQNKIKFIVRNETYVQSISSSEGYLKICYQGALYKRVEFSVVVVAAVGRAYDLNVTDSEIRNNNGRGIWVENQRSGTVINRTTIEGSNYVAGVHIASGIGDVIINSSSIINNNGDGINVTTLGGYKHIDKCDIENNTKRGIAIWINESNPYESKNHITYSTIRYNSGVGILMSNVCRSDTFWNISMNTFYGNYDDSIKLFTCWSPQAMTELRITNNIFREGKRLAIHIAPAYQLHSIIEHNIFSYHTKGVIFINSYDYVYETDEYESLKADIKINDNLFANNTGTFVVNIGLYENSPNQKLHFFRNILRENVISEPYSNLVPRSRVAAVIAISSSNCFVIRNNLINPKSKYDIGSHLDHHAKIIDATYNYFGDYFRLLDTLEIHKRIFDRKNRYNLASVKYIQYRTNEHAFDGDEFLSHVLEKDKYIPFHRDKNILGGELFAKEYNLPPGIYTVDKDIFVRQNSTLILNAGTTLKFAQSVGMMVQGKIEFSNNQHSRIIFTSMQDSFVNLGLNKNLTNKVRKKNISTFDVSLSSGTHGRVEVVIDGIRGAVCSYGFDIVDASIVCQTIGMVVNKRDWLLEKSEYNNTQPLDIILSNVQCTSLDYDLSTCKAERKDEFRNSCPSAVGIRCYNPTWSGIRMGMSAEKMEIKNIVIEKAGLYDYTLNTFKPALQIDFNRHKLFNIKIHQNVDSGIGIIWNDVLTSNRYLTITDSEISFNGYNGITSHSQGIEIARCIFEKNKGSAFYYKPLLTKWEQIDLVSWITPNKPQSVINLPEQLPRSGNIFLNPNLQNTWYIFINKTFDIVTFTFNIQTQLTYAIGIMVLNPIYDENDASLTVFHKNRPDEPKIDLKTNISSFPIWKYSYEISFNYSANLPKSNIILYLVVEKIDSSFKNIITQEKDINRRIKSTKLSQNNFIENFHGFSSSHYDIDIGPNNMIFHRHNNETFLLEENLFEKSQTESILISTPFYNAKEFTLSEINYTLINNRFINNNQGILQISKDYRNSNNLFHWTIKGSYFNKNLNEGIDIKLPYVWQFNENFTHTISINNNTFLDNNNFKFSIDGHFTRLNITYNIFRKNTCKTGLIMLGGMEKEMKIHNNLIESNYGKFMVEFNIQSHADKFGLVVAEFSKNSLLENEGPVSPSFDRYSPFSYAIALRGVQFINITRNLLRNPVLQYEFLAGVLTGSLDNNINVAENWWNTIDTKEIKQRIFDFDDWNSYAVATISPILSKASIDASAINIHLKEETLNLDEPFGGRVHGSLRFKTRSQPYVINTDLTILPSANLTIEPGVIVELYPSVGILVLGEMIAKGTENAKIKFRPVSSSPNIEIAQTYGNNNKFKRSHQFGDIRLCHTESCLEWYSKKINDGFLEVFNKTTLQWIPICDRKFSERTAQVMCHQMGFSKLNVHLKRGKRIDMGPTYISQIQHSIPLFMCTGKEKYIDDCVVEENNFENFTYHCSYDSDQFIYLYCSHKTDEENSYWGGIRYSIPGFEINTDANFHLPIRSYNSPHSWLKYVEISKAGILHGEKNAAIQIIQRDVNMEFVEIKNCAYHAIESIAPKRHLLFHRLNIHDNYGAGLNYLVLDGASLPVQNLPYIPLQESTLPYNVFSLVDICDTNKNLIIKQRILLYYKYDTRSVDCVKIVKSTIRSRKIAFRLLQFNLFNPSDSSQTDYIRVYDGNIFNQTVQLKADLTSDAIDEENFSYYESSQDTLSIRLHASGGGGSYGFIAEIVITSSSNYIGRGFYHNITEGLIVNNTLGAIIYRSASEISPNVAIMNGGFMSNCLPLYGNFSTCSGALSLELQNTLNFFFSNNLVKENDGGLNLKLYASSFSSSLQAGQISNNLFTSNRKNEVLIIKEIKGAMQYLDIFRNYFSDNHSPYRSNIVLTNVSCNFSQNIVVRNVGYHQLHLVGSIHSQHVLYRNWLYDNLAKHLEEKSTIFANNFGQEYTFNYFTNPENNFEIATQNISDQLRSWWIKSSINASYNWWGFNESGAVSGRIRDATDDYHLILVDFKPYLHSNSSVLSGICPGGWEEIDETCFLYFGARMNYYEAKLFCKEHNSTMPVVNINLDELTSYFERSQVNFNKHYHPVWVQSFSFLQSDCTALINKRIEKFDCSERFSFVCERDPDINIIVTHWYRERLGLTALIFSFITAIFTFLFLMCWTCKSRERHKEKLIRRNSFRISTLNRSNSLMYKRSLDSMNNMRQHEQPLGAANLLTNNFKTNKDSSFDSFEKNPAHFNECSDESYSASRQDFIEIEDKFANDLELENANVALKLKPTFDLTYQNEGFKETPSFSRRDERDLGRDYYGDSPTNIVSTFISKRTESPLSQRGLYRSSPHLYEEYSRKTPSPPSANKQHYRDIYNYKPSSQYSLNGPGSDTTGITSSDRCYLETSLDGDNNYDYYDNNSNRFPPTSPITSHNRPTLETAM